MSFPLLTDNMEYYSTDSAKIQVHIMKEDEIKYSNKWKTVKMSKNAITEGS